MKSALKLKVGDIPVIYSRWTYLPYVGYSPFGQIDQSKHPKGSIGVLSQTAIVRLGETPEMLERQERMLNPGSHTRLFTIGLLIGISQWTTLVRTPIGKIPCVGCAGFEKPPLILVPVSAIALESSLITVQEVWQLLAIMRIARSHTDAVYQPSLTIHPNIYLHSKVPLIAFLALVHLWIPHLLSVLGGGRRSNQRSIHNGAARELHPIGLNQLTDLSKERCTNLAPFQQVAEIEQGHRIGYSFTPEVNLAEVPECWNVIQSFFKRLISQVEAIGNKVYSKHSLQVRRRTPIPDLRIMRYDQRAECSPRNKPSMRARNAALRVALP